MEEKNNKYQSVRGSDAFEEMLKKEQMNFYCKIMVKMLLYNNK